MEQRLLGLLAQAGLLPGGGSGGGGSDLGAAVKPEPVDGTPATMPCTPPAAPAAEAEAAAAAAALGRGPHVLSDFTTLLTEMPDMGAELDAEEQGKVGGWVGGWVGGCRGVGWVGGSPAFGALWRQQRGPLGAPQRYKDVSLPAGCSVDCK